MSLGMVHRHKEMSDSRYIADLVGLFERRKIPVGDARVCEHFETLLTGSDAFRSQLFTLCAAMSRMSPIDLTGEELLDLVGRALGVTKGAADLPESVRAEFLAGYDAWIHRDLIGGDDWPPGRKPPVREEVGRHPGPAEARTPEAASRTAPPARPAGLPTLQEALELAKQRGQIEPPPAREEAAAPVEPAENHPRVDMSALTIHELNALLKEIEERMARLSPHLWKTPPATEPGIVPRREPEPVGFPEPLDPTTSRTAPPAPPLFVPPQAPSAYVPSFQPIPMQPTAFPPEPAEPSAPTEYREDDFLARHSYLQPGWRPMTEPTYEIIPDPPDAAQDGGPTLVHPTSFVSRVQAGPSAAPEKTNLTMYVLIAALAAVVLIGAPLAGMVVYRSLHPVYVYHLPPSAPAPAQPVETAPAPVANSPATAKPQANPGARKRQAHRRQPPGVTVWPLAPQR